MIIFIGDAQDVKKGSALGGIFIARDRFLILEKSTRQLIIKSFQNDIIKRITSPYSNIDNIFFGGIMGRVLLKTEDKVIL